ncbi:MAG TPA: S-adenosylmethionine decarboxylase [Capsulimonadaceae bacterium]|jgi:S-adenosylmethionine decarboxylase
MNNSDTTYGMHLTLRISEVSRREALDGPKIGDLLVTLVNRIGMRILAGPLTAEESGTPERRGWSSLVLLYESHAAIHTYPELGQAFIDVFSCKEFSMEQVKDVLLEYLGDFRTVEENVLDRGIHWSQGIDREMAGWVGQR